jgi:hypothetical protein
MADEDAVPSDDPVDDVDPGQPIGLLANLTEEPRAGFLEGIRRRIRRKTLTADTAQLWWAGLPFVLFEFVKMIVQLAAGRVEEKETSDGSSD